MERTSLKGFLLFLKDLRIGKMGIPVYYNSLQKARVCNRKILRFPRKNRICGRETVVLKGVVISGGSGSGSSNKSSRYIDSVCNH